MNTFKVTKEDVLDVAERIHFRPIDEKEMEWVLLCYEDAQRQDPSGTWDLVVEDLLYGLNTFKKTE